MRHFSDSEVSAKRRHWIAFSRVALSVFVFAEIGVGGRGVGLRDQREINLSNCFWGVKGLDWTRDVM